MRIRPSVTALSIGLAAVVVILGAAKFVSDHRKDRLEEAFQMLAAGSERLNGADPEGALRQFGESIARFEDVGRDPLMALHYAFAARLRSQASIRGQVRELALPALREGEALLALALSDDSTFLAVVTQRRLLCLPLASERWAEWEVPRPMERAGALYVESKAGTMHFVTGDDGRLLSADCRAPESSLASTESATSNQPAVAWLDAAEGIAWIAPVAPAGAEVKIAMQPFSGAKRESTHMRVAFPGEANPLFPDPAVVHAIGKIDDNLLLFYGDARVLSDADMRDESVLVVSVDEPDRRRNLLVFAALADEDEKGKVRWRSTRVSRLLPATAPGRVYAMTDVPPGVTVLGSDAKEVDVHADSLFSTQYDDGGELYDLVVKSSGKAAAMEIRRRSTGARLDYELPWRFEREPGLAAISAEGRRVVVANETGSVLLIDLSQDPTS